MTSLKTSSQKLTSKEQDDNELHLKESKEQDDNQLHLEERTILSFGNDDDSSFHSDKPEVEDKEIAEMLADLTEDENEQLVKRTSISKEEKKRDIEATRKILTNDSYSQTSVLSPFARYGTAP